MNIEKYIQISNPKREGHPRHHEPPRFAMKNRATSLQDKSYTKTKDISYAERKIYKENVDLRTLSLFKNCLDFSKLKILTDQVKFSLIQLTLERRVRTVNLKPGRLFAPRYPSLILEVWTIIYILQQDFRFSRIITIIKFP